jgi:SAM-dependent methyltransferase
VGLNSYSRRWFNVFEATHPYTANEIDFLARQLPNPPVRRILDLCCGRGRHAIPLAKLGYNVVGVDCDPDLIREAQQHAADNGVADRCTFVVADVREVATLRGSFDAVIVLWQSFGFFDEAENAQLLSDLAGKLTTGGRIVLDLYNLDWWREHAGTSTTERGGRTIESVCTLRGARLSVKLAYDGDTTTDDFEWQLFSADEIQQLGARFGLSPVLVCSEFNEDKVLSDQDKVMQVVLTRTT